MKWNNDRSLLLSRVCVWVFTVLLAALLLTAPLVLELDSVAPSVRMVYIGVTYASGVPAAVVLFCLHRLLRNISEEEVFIQGERAQPAHHVLVPDRGRAGVSGGQPV